tara:strand:+ start:338 stop:766 length:429 start_codon:yes stop_codon:yes gene_type:complete
MIIINSVEKSDCVKLIEIEKGLFNNPTSIVELENYFNEVSIKIWKLQTTKIIGFACFYHVKDEVEILKIGVLKSCQRKKYGSLIINEIKKLKIKKIFLEVSVENLQAINFYLKNGFKKIGIRKAYYKRNKQRIDALRLLFEF